MDGEAKEANGDGFQGVMRIVDTAEGDYGQVHTRNSKHWTYNDR